MLFSARALTLLLPDATLTSLLECGASSGTMPLAAMRAKRQSCAMKKEPHHGFTLPELLFVLVIVGILSLGALQGWQRWQQRQQLRETAQQLQGFLQRLRAQANWQNQDRALWLMPGERWCLGSGPKPDAGCERGRRLQFIAPYPGVSLTSVRGEPGFYGRRNMAKAGSLEFGNASGRLRLIISARARIRLCQPEEQGCD